MLLGAIAVLVCGWEISQACAWDSDTLGDEAHLKPELFDVITGQFPHHGEAYYRERIRRLTGKLGKQDNSFLARNDLAVAHMRVGQYMKAEHLLKENLAEQPGDYFTISNLGVLAKKRGNFGEAAGWIEKALEIRPEGHLGIGDWYLKMLIYREMAHHSGDREPPANFLGQSYATSFHPPRMDVVELPPAFRPGLDLAERERLVLLLQNDQSFADGFVLLGDMLANTGDLNLAFLAFTRAIELNHSNDSEIRRRRRELLGLFHAAEDTDFPDLMAYWRMRIAEAEDHLVKASHWLPKFQKIEAEMAKNALPKLSDVSAEAEKRGVTRYRPEESKQPGAVIRKRPS